MSNQLVEWTPEMEINLFYAMIDHKPVGENKHFHMMFIYEKFNNLSEKKLSVEQIWEHLSSLYDLQALDEVEVLPFPNDECEFSLPEMDTSKSSNSDDLESSIKSTSTSGKNEPVRTIASTPASAQTKSAASTPQGRATPSTSKSKKK